MAMVKKVEASSPGVIVVSPCGGQKKPHAKRYSKLELNMAGFVGVTITRRKNCSGDTRSPPTLIGESNLDYFV